MNVKNIRNFPLLKCPAAILARIQGTSSGKRYTTIYLLSAECEVRTASYGPGFFLPFMAQARSARAMKTRKEKTRSITCHKDRTNEANKMFIIWLC